MPHLILTGKMQHLVLTVYLILVSFISISKCWYFERGLWDTVKYNTISRLKERCDDRWVTQNIFGLSNELYNNVYGQELAIEVIVGALELHSQRKYRKKPLVISFHGMTGVGKGYVADFIVKHWFKEGERSSFVKKYVGGRNFTVKDKLYEYQEQLHHDLEDTVRKCKKAMFVFDEVDKYIPHVLDGIKPYLDYSSSINGLDFRESTFIFLTNSGGDLVTHIAFMKWVEGIPRKDLELSDFEKDLKALSYNEEGGLYHSSIIKHHLIDHVVPFLPLEKSHVKACIETDLLKRGGDFGLVNDIVSAVMEQLTFGPYDSNLFSEVGCKMHEKVGHFLQRRERRRRKSSDEL